MSTLMQLGGAVLPSFMRLKKPSNNHSLYNNFNDVSLKVGTVVACYSPSDTNNFSQSVWEYDVNVMTSHGNEVPTTTMYRNCHMQSYFGGVANKLLWTPNVQVLQKDAQGNATGTVQTPGTVVLLQCIQGITLYGIITGCLQPDGASSETEDFGDGSGGMVPTLAWQYNGIRVDIDKDGAFTIQRRGPTQADGSYVNAAPSNPPINGFDELNDGADDPAANALFSFAKDGTITLQSGNGNDSFVIDPQDNVTLTADQDLTLTANKGSAKLSAQQGCEISDGVGAKATIADGTFKFEANGIELIQQILNVIQALQSATVMTSLGPQPLDPPTLASLIQAQVNIQLIKG